MLFISKFVTLLFSVHVLIGCSRANKLQTVYQWQEIDFKYNNADERQAAIDAKTFIPQNVIPVAMEVVENRLFLTLPRLRPGVPASLAYIDLNELPSSQSPLLMPYPSWQAHTSLQNNKMDIVSPIAIKADRCGHLWVLDAGIDNVQLLGYDLRSNDLFERFTIPKDQLGAQKSNFTSIVADDNDCAKLYVYIAEPSAPALIVYSSTERKSWRVNHHFFHPNPLTGNFTVGNIKYQPQLGGVYGLALSEAQKDGFADLYFHPLSSTNEFKVSTAVLHNETLSISNAIYKEFAVLGARELNGQSGASFYDRKNGVIFYTLPNLNEIGCWKTTNNYSVANVYADSVEMTYPSDVRVSEKEQLWVLTNNLPRFLYDRLDATVINFRILRGSVKDLIKGTACEKTLIEKITKIGEKILPSTSKDSKGHSNDIRPIGLTICFMSLLAVIKAHLF